MRRSGTTMTAIETCSDKPPPAGNTVLSFVPTPVAVYKPSTMQATEVAACGKGAEHEWLGGARLLCSPSGTKQRRGRRALDPTRQSSRTGGRAAAIAWARVSKTSPTANNCQHDLSFCQPYHLLTWPPLSTSSPKRWLAVELLCAVVGECSHPFPIYRAARSVSIAEHYPHNDSCVGISSSRCRLPLRSTSSHCDFHPTELSDLVRAGAYLRRHSLTLR
jgi:hypothetical protein